MPGVPPTRFAYLGPQGTFSEAALRTVPAATRAELLACPTVPATLDAVRHGDADAGMVPIENSVEGSVNATLDELAAGDPLLITREVVLPVTFALLARAGTSVEDVRTVVTHPHAEAQCRRWLATRLPGARVLPASSTAAAAALVADPGSGVDAAVASAVAADHYPVVALAADIGDNPQAATRFVLVSRPGPLPTPTGADRTSLVAFLRADHPGALLEILEEFGVRGINLTRIESRPTGDGFGRYCFSVDAEGHLQEERVGEALMGLRRLCAAVRFLGSYPRADAQPPGALRYGTSDADFRDARAWLTRLRDGGG